MDITPVEIKEKRFRTVFMGYNPKEVDAFISMVADSYEGLANEANTLRDEARRISNDLDLYKGREGSIKETIMTAQKLCDDMKRNAGKECEIKLAEAEMKAEKIIAEAEKRLDMIRGEIAEMRRQRLQFEESLRSVLTTHFKLLSVSREEG